MNVSNPIVGQSLKDETYTNPASPMFTEECTSLPLPSSPTPIIHPLLSSSPIAPAFSIPRLNSEQIAIISRYILSLRLSSPLRDLLLFFVRRAVHRRSSISPSQNSCQILCPPRSARLEVLSTTTEMTVGRASSIFDEGRGRPTERGKERHRKNLLMLQLL